MNTYVVPFGTNDGVWIEKITARSLQEAKDKIIETYVNLWDLDYPGDWSEFVDIIEAANAQVGDVIDIDAL